MASIRTKTGTAKFLGYPILSQEQVKLRLRTSNFVRIFVSSIGRKAQKCSTNQKLSKCIKMWMSWEITSEWFYISLSFPTNLNVITSWRNYISILTRSVNCNWFNYLSTTSSDSLKRQSRMPVTGLSSLLLVLARWPTRSTASSASTWCATYSRLGTDIAYSHTTLYTYVQLKVGYTQIGGHLL